MFLRRSPAAPGKALMSEEASALVRGVVDEHLKSAILTPADLVEHRKSYTLEGLASLIGRAFEERPENDLYEALYGGSAPLRQAPAVIGFTSALCRQIHFSLDEYRYWMQRMGRLPRMHRKDWEWFFIAQALFERDKLVSGNRGLVFAVGQEPLPSLFATMGCDIVASDQAPEAAAASGWAQSNMYSSHVNSLHNSAVIDRDSFLSHVTFEHADMNDIPAHFREGFDFCWSSCALEHLGSLEHGMQFVENSMDTLRPGGIAVHTTEYNLSSNGVTTETPGTSIYRRRDIEELVARLERKGHYVEPIDWTVGRGFAETVIDKPPYRQSPHLKLCYDGYDCTSIGLIIQKQV